MISSWIFIAWASATAKRLWAYLSIMPPKNGQLKKKICLPTCTLYQQLVQNLLTAKFYLKIRYPSALFLSWIYDMKMWFVAITWIMCDKSVWSISCIPEINLGRMNKHNLVPCLIKHHQNCLKWFFSWF